MTSPFPSYLRDLVGPPERLSVSEWADRHRHLPATDPKPGPWRTDTTPFIREVMDAAADPAVEELVVMAGAQVGKSRLLENVAGYIADEDPADMLMVCARDQDCRTVADTRLLPMLQASPRIRTLCGGVEPTHESWKFRACTLFLAASNSPAGLASKSCRVVLLDEIGKWPDSIKQEGNPIDLARQRTNAFAGRRKIIAVSSATTDRHGIAPEYDRTDRRTYRVPCPHCGHHQELVWTQVKFEGRDPNDLDGKVWYECESCGGKWDDVQKRKAVAKGVWAPGGVEVGKDGKVKVERPARSRGYHIVGLLSPFRPMADFVSRFLKAHKNRSKLGVFFRSDLGVPWMDTVDDRPDIDAESARSDYSMLEVPDGVEVLTAGVDVGKHESHWVVRGWKKGLESWLIDRGVGPSLEAIVEDLLQRDFGGHQVRMLFCDSGYDTTRVLKISHRYRNRMRPIRGDTKINQMIVAHNVEKLPDGRPVKRGIKRFSLHVDLFKNELASLRAREIWKLPKDIDDNYLQHMDAETLVLDDKGKERWVPKTEGAANHFFDCENYALAAAWALGGWRVNEAPAKPSQAPKRTAAKPAAPKAQAPARRGPVGSLRRGGRNNRRRPFGG
ncbi:MAG: terminase gpA endonuclease subunit [Planctomycetota bacterium]